MAGEIEKNIAKSERWLRDLSALIPSTVTLSNTVASMAEVANAGLLSRLIEIGEEGVLALRAERAVSSALLSRAAIETASSQHDFVVKVTAVLSEASESPRKVLLSYLLGTRMEGDIRATNVLTFIDRLSKDIPQLRYYYDVLCEFAHPNAWGVLSALTSDLQVRRESTNAQSGATAASRVLGLSVSAIMLRVALARGYSTTVALHDEFARAGQRIST